MTSSIRSTMRVNLNFFDTDTSPTPPPGTIYYLKSSTPHLHDISLFGPFNSLEALVPSLRQKLSETSPFGLQTFDDLMKSPGGISSFDRLVAPLDGGHELIIQLVKVHNPEVAASLPGPAWSLMRAEVLPQPGDMQLKSLEIAGAYTSARAANEAGREMLAEKLREMTGARKMERLKEDGTMTGIVMNSRATWMLEVKFDSGRETFPDEQ